MANNVGNLLRALRLPFVTASVLPFILGSLIARDNLHIFRFLLGLLAVMATHLGANLINDYADSRTGLDWQDRAFYKFFGGSKLIQEKVFSEQFYLYLALSLFLVAGISVVTLALNLRSLSIIVFFILIISLAWSYSASPLKLSYRRLGEFVIFLLFGPVPVMGGYFIQTGIFPTPEGFFLSLPYGFFTTAILFANEIPDYPQDRNGGKFTWVSLWGQKSAFRLYFLLISLGFTAIILNVLLGYLTVLALFSLVFVLPAVKAAGILRRYFEDKIKLLESSRLTIAVQALTGIILILCIRR